VPGLAAKPVIDIQVSVASLVPHGRYVDTMATLGYRHVALGNFDLVYPFFYGRPSGPEPIISICATLEESKSGSTWRFETTCAHILKSQENMKPSNASSRVHTTERHCNPARRTRCRSRGSWPTCYARQEQAVTPNITMNPTSASRCSAAAGYRGRYPVVRLCLASLSGHGESAPGRFMVDLR
jgi:GrpB protein